MNLLATDRLILRDFREGDFDAVHAYGSDPEVVQWVAWGPNTEADTRTFIERAIERAGAEPRLNYSLAIVRKDDDKLVGGMALYLESAEAHSAMLGYVLAKEAWGFGFATEASEAMVDFGFDVLGLHRIWAACDPANAGSAHVLEKIGMTLEGRLRDDQRIRGVFRDSLVYGVLSHER